MSTPITIGSAQAAVDLREQLDQLAGWLTAAMASSSGLIGANPRPRWRPRPSRSVPVRQASGLAARRGLVSATAASSITLVCSSDLSCSEFRPPASCLSAGDLMRSVPLAVDVTEEVVARFNARVHARQVDTPGAVLRLGGAGCPRTCRHCRCGPVIGRRSRPVTGDEHDGDEDGQGNGLHGASNLVIAGSGRQGPVRVALTL